MANKRISLKGRGADIFFGEYEPDNVIALPTATADADQSPVEPIDPSDNRQDDPPITPDLSGPTPVAPPQARAHARKQESKKAHVHPSEHATKVSPSPWTGELVERVCELVSEPATITNAFRYTDQELSDLTDALYEITKRHRVKLSKQDVARLGLNVVLEEYRRRGDDSLLGELVQRKQRPHRPST